MARSTASFCAVEVARLTDHQERASRSLQTTRPANGWGIHGHEVDVVADGHLPGDGLDRVLGVEFLILGLEGVERLVGEVGGVAPVRAQ